MESAPVAASTPASGDNAEKNQKGGKPPLPELSNFEKGVRVVSIPISALAAYYYIVHQSRNGIRALFTDQKWFKPFVDARDKALKEAKDHPNKETLYHRIDVIDKEFKKVTNREMKENGFKWTWQYFAKNERSKKLEILMTAGAAFSIALGFFAMVAEPRNRSAIKGWFGGKKDEASDKNSNEPKPQPQAPAKNASSPEASASGKRFAAEKLKTTGYSAFIPRDLQQDKEVPVQR